MREFVASALLGFFNTIDVNRSLQNTTVDDAVGGKAVVRGRPSRHGSRGVCQGDLGSWPPDDETGLQIFSID
jgi:hypothetical protein